MKLIKRVITLINKSIEEMTDAEMAELIANAEIV